MSSIKFAKEYHQQWILIPSIDISVFHLATWYDHSLLVLLIDIYPFSHSLNTHLLSTYYTQALCLELGIQGWTTLFVIYWERQAHNSNTCCIICSKCYRSTEDGDCLPRQGNFYTVSDNLIKSKRMRNINWWFPGYVMTSLKTFQGEQAVFLFLCSGFI